MTTYPLFSFCRNTKKIQFRDLADLRKVLGKCSLAPDRPSRLCTAHSCTTAVLYFDESTQQGQLKILKCFKVPKSPGSITGIVGPCGKEIWDSILIPNDNKKHLIVMVAGITKEIEGKYFKCASEICAVSLKSQIVWSVKGKLPGFEKEMCAESITTDEKGRVFVCDTNNNCVHVVSAENGIYVGCLLKEGERNLGKPRLIRWSKRLSSLIVTHTYGFGYSSRISVVYAEQ